MLEGNSFTSSSVELIRRVTGLLTGSTSLKTVSLKNNFKNGTHLARGAFVVTPAMLEQITSGISQFQELFKDSLADANKDTRTDYVTKEILFDDMPPLSIITEVKLPRSSGEKIRAFLVKMGLGLGSIIVSTGGTILTIYLTGYLGHGGGCDSSGN